MEIPGWDTVFGGIFFVAASVSLCWTWDFLRDEYKALTVRVPLSLLGLAGALIFFYATHIMWQLDLPGFLRR